MSLRKLLDDHVAPHFERGRKLERLYPMYEAIDTFLYTPGEVTRTSSHVRDGVDFKRLISVVVVALIPCALMAMYNTGYQAASAIAAGAMPLDDWRTALFTGVGFEFNPEAWFACTVLGALYFLPALVVCYAAGGAVEVGCCIIRKHDVNEGLLATGLLIPLTLPPTVPLWQIAVCTAVGVLFAKEVFGGTGMNFLNPALAVRALLFFAYPGRMSGTDPWIAADLSVIDSFTGATWLAQAAETPGVLEGVSWWTAFLGRIPGSMGETSTLFCLLGAVLLLVTAVGSWRTMAAVALGSIGMSLVLNLIGSETNPLFGMPFWWHFVLGGWAFGAVFMATDPVSSSFTDRGKWYYGAGIGVLAVLIRVTNPAYPEGMMLAILFMNMFAPLIDHYVVRANIKRRQARYAAR